MWTIVAYCVDVEFLEMASSAMEVKEFLHKENIHVLLCMRASVAAGSRRGCVNSYGKSKGESQTRETNRHIIYTIASVL